MTSLVRIYPLTDAGASKNYSNPLSTFLFDSNPLAIPPASRTQIRYQTGMHFNPAAATISPLLVLVYFWPRFPCHFYEIPLASIILDRESTSIQIGPVVGQIFQDHAYFMRKCVH